MSALISLLLGSMLGRVAGPIAQDYFENETEMGRRIMSRKEEREIRKEQRALEQKIKVSEKEHNDRLKEMRDKNEERRVETETQYVRAFTDENMRKFLKDCWPLRNPFDAPLAIEPKYNETKQMVEGYRLKTVITPNNMEIVPLRFISALKGNAHPEAETINSELSMFLVNNYSTNSEHAVLSEIGAWREDIPVNDASINYLFKGMKGQPAMVLVPEFQHHGNMVRFKIWSWGLGEKLIYPVGFDFGWLDLTGLYNRILASESKKMIGTLKKIGFTPTSDEIKKNDKILSSLTKTDVNLSKEDRDRILYLLDTPLEINVSLRKRFSQVIANVFSAISAMYTDGYHLMEYGTKPLLPSILPTLQDIPFMIPSITSYYQSICNTALTTAIIKVEDAIEIELTLAHSIKQAYPKQADLKELINNIRMLNDNIEGPIHKKAIEHIRVLTASSTTLTQQ